MPKSLYPPNSGLISFTGLTNTSLVLYTPQNDEQIVYSDGCHTRFRRASRGGGEASHFTAGLNPTPASGLSHGAIRIAGARSACSLK